MVKDAIFRDQGIISQDAFIALFKRRHHLVRQ
jgi:hypothetical protein